MRQANACGTCPIEIDAPAAHPPIRLAAHHLTTQGVLTAPPLFSDLRLAAFTTLFYVTMWPMRGGGKHGVWPHADIQQ